jgi:mRNA-degrading endonuclease RelE of RelBE toxin-antitoxin system
MNVTYHPEARAELLEAVQFYEQRVAGLGAEFLAEFEGAIQTIQSAPERWMMIDEHRRRYRLKRFPYSVIYRVIGEEIRVLVVRHHKRSPSHGDQRMI